MEVFSPSWESHQQMLSASSDIKPYINFLNVTADELDSCLRQKIKTTDQLHHQPQLSRPAAQQPMARLPIHHAHPPHQSRPSHMSSHSPPTTATATAAAVDSHKHLRFPSQILKDPYLSAAQQRLRSRRRDALAPDFDVRETEAAFFLEGELPGIADRSAIRLDWIDRRTLAIDAKIEKVDLEAEWGPLVRGLRRDSGTGSDEGEEMVVDEDATERNGGAANGGIVMRRRSPGAETNALLREWLSERRLGHYQRTFTFPTDVDASAIRARLGQGLLRVMVPKVVKTGVEVKQVAIESCE